MKERERRVAAEGGSLGAYDGLYQGEATAASRQWWRWHDTCSVHCPIHGGSNIRDAAFFFFGRKSSDITTPSRGGCSSGRSTRDQCPTHAAKGKRSRLFTFNVDVDG